MSPNEKRVDASDFLAHHHSVAVVGFACAAVLLTDLQRVDAGLCGAGEHLSVDPAFAVPVMLVRYDFASEELPYGFAVRLVVGFRRTSAPLAQSRSMMVTLACPPPSHMVCSP